MEGDDDRRLDAAVALNIITAAQAQAIRDLVPARAPIASRPLGAATLGYVLGALTVLIAMGWFLADRWTWLGAGGVLAVATLYAALFLVVAWRLRGEGFPQASGFAVLLAVGMVPVAVVAVNELAGWFTAPTGGVCGYPDFMLWTCRGEEIVVELATLAAALFALRQVRFSLFVVPIAAILLRFLFHAADAVGRAGLGAVSAAWVWMIGASLLTAAAYETARRQDGDEDFALWLHLVAAISAGVASMMLLGRFESFRHLLIPAALLAFAFSLRMARFVWTLLGLAWFVGYLGWLASEVFRDTPFFPIVLAALGVGVIIVTVWVQRNSAMLVERFGGLAADGRPSFPGGVGLLLLPTIVAALQLPGAAELDRADRRAMDASGRAFGALRRHEEQDARDPVIRVTPEETPRPPVP
jgi:hypothetical protein